VRILAVLHGLFILIHAVVLAAVDIFKRRCHAVLPFNYEIVALVSFEVHMTFKLQLQFGL
jgi:hypothetical protein